MRIYSMTEAPPGSPSWWELRRGVVTASVADMILTPKQCRPSTQQKRLQAMLIADLVSQSPTWFTENHTKPPNKAIDDGIAREAESKRWYSLANDVDLVEIGFALADDGRTGCSPDALAGDDLVVEMKNPTLAVHTEYFDDPMDLEDAYRAQVHFQMWVLGRPRAHLVSYCPPLPPVVVEVERGTFTEALADETLRFLEKFSDMKRRLGIPEHVTTEGEILT